MDPSYRHLALADVRPGMVLSDGLLDRQGQMLLPQGAVLTAPIIALLPRHGIEALTVLRHTNISAGGADSAEAAPDYAMLAQRLDHLFRRNHMRNDDVDPHADAAGATLRRCLADCRRGGKRAK